jgi:hypothetical protein
MPEIRTGTTLHPDENEIARSIDNYIGRHM